MAKPSQPVPNGQPSPTMNVEQQKEFGKLLDRYQDIVHNLQTSRQAFFNQYLDPRRDLNKECGYPASTYSITPDFYRNLYDSEGIPRRVVDVLPQECWQVQPEIYEDEDEGNDTEFEKAWRELASSLRVKSWYEDESCTPIWEALKRADELSGIGHFGVLLLGFSDGKALSDPVDGVTQDSGNLVSVAGFDQDNKAQPVIPLSLEGTDVQYQGTQFAPNSPAGETKNGLQLSFIRAFDESLVQIVRYEANVNNPRFGLPVMYKITFNDPRQQHTGVGLPLATLMVHWSRVIHIADRLGSSEVFGTPRMQPSLHRILDLCKLYSGSAEMYWKGAFPGISFETHPQLGGEVNVDAESIRSQMYEWQNDLQRFLLTTGMSAKTLSPQVVDPSPQIETQLQALCIEIGIPQRIFMGSERGELASSQDAKTWGMRVNFRQVMYLTPKVVVPFIDRLIMCGVLPEPESYNVRWPMIDAMTETEKATTAQQLTMALSSYVSGGVEAAITLQDYFVHILGMDSALAEQLVENAMSQEPEDSATLPDPNDAVDAQGNPIGGEPEEGETSPTENVKKAPAGK